MTEPTRRDFLKLGALLAGWTAFPRVVPSDRRAAGGPNIILLVLDAMSAANLSVYGYQRRTTPNLERLAERASVYHRHYSSGSFTTPGTASILTGVYPWTHRALHASGLIRPDLVHRNVFGLLGGARVRAGYTQNYWADYLLNQLREDLDLHIPLSSFGLLKDTIVDQKFLEDPLLAYRSYATTFFPWIREQPSSLLLSFFYNLYYQGRVRELTPVEYPLGLPASNTLHYVFTLEDVFDGVMKEVLTLKRNGSPYIAYLHLWPPHDPYRPSADYAGKFTDDGFVPTIKPQHSLSTDFSPEGLATHRREYDEYLAHVDAEFGRTMSVWEEEGALDNTMLIVTSDHGEMFERGVFGHFTPLLYEPVIRVPLLIFGPGPGRRRDYLGLTSNIDLLPTLLEVCGVDIPPWVEGQVLPGFGGDEVQKRVLFAMDAKENSAGKPLTKATLAMMSDRYKLIRYLGYKGRYNDFVELYDLVEDPDELRNLAEKDRVASVRSAMLVELNAALEAADRPYR